MTLYAYVNTVFEVSVAKVSTTFFRYYFHPFSPDGVKTPPFFEEAILFT